MVTEGNIYDVKEAMITHISEADESLQPKTTHVFPKWNLDVWETDSAKMPVVTVRIGPANINETVYGRQLGGDKRGNHVVYFFTAHVHHENDTGTEPSKKAMDLADKIITKLEQSEDSSSGIVYYDGLTYREASALHYGLSRVIIEGYVFVRRPIS